MPTLTLICGPSGAGKSTLEKMLTARGVTRLCSTTSRPQRPGEVHGVDYNFVEREQFQEGLRSGLFIEHTEYNKNFYGLTYDDVESSLRMGSEYAAGQHAVAVLDIQGCLPLFERYGRQPGRDTLVQGVFLDADPTTLFNRLVKRADLTEQLLHERAALFDRDKAWKKHFVKMAGDDDNRIRLLAYENITLSEMGLLADNLVSTAFRLEEARRAAVTAKADAQKEKVTQKEHALREKIKHSAAGPGMGM